MKLSVITQAMSDYRTGDRCPYMPGTEEHHQYHIATAAILRGEIAVTPNHKEKPPCSYSPAA